MCAEKKNSPAPNVLWSVFTNRCPRCREGKLYSNSNAYAFKGDTMYQNCPVCGQRYHLHTGFFFGTGYVSYGLSIIVMAVVFVFWGLLFGLSFNDNSLLWCLGAATAILIILQPILQRLSRSMWIAMFVKYDPDWRESNVSAELFE